MFQNLFHIKLAILYKDIFIINSRLVQFTVQYILRYEPIIKPCLKYTVCHRNCPLFILKQSPGSRQMPGQETFPAFSPGEIHP